MQKRKPSGTAAPRTDARGESAPPTDFSANPAGGRCVKNPHLPRIAPMRLQKSGFRGHGEFRPASERGMGERKLGCKPDSVVPEGTGIHLSAPKRGPREGCDIPNALERAVPHPMLSCTGLGFQCPRRLLPRRWALTPPFHPYRSRGGLFSAALSVRAPCGARPALSDGIPLCGVRTFLPRTSRGRMPAQNSQRTPFRYRPIRKFRKPPPDFRRN